MRPLGVPNTFPSIKSCIPIINYSKSILGFIQFLSHPLILALIERRGVRVALITFRGAENELEPYESQLARVPFLFFPLSLLLSFLSSLFFSPFQPSRFCCQGRNKVGFWGSKSDGSMGVGPSLGLVHFYAC